MKVAFILILLIAGSLSSISCATIYEGFTVIRIKAKEFKGQAGPFHNFEGKGVDASIIRKMSLTGSEERSLEDNPDVKMSAAGDNSTFDIINKPKGD